MAQAGFKCKQDTSCSGVDIKFTGGHPQDLLALTHGTVDAAEINSQEQLKRRPRPASSRPPTTARSGSRRPIPNDPITVRTNLPAAFKAEGRQGPAEPARLAAEGRRRGARDRLGRPPDPRPQRALRRDRRPGRQGGPRDQRPRLGSADDLTHRFSGRPSGPATPLPRRWRCAVCASRSVTTTSCAASISTWLPVSWWSCSAPTAAASRRCCAARSACSTPTRARSSCAAPI